MSPHPSLSEGMRFIIRVKRKAEAECVWNEMLSYTCEAKGFTKIIDL